MIFFDRRALTSLNEASLSQTPVGISGVEVLLRSVELLEQTVLGPLCGH